MPRSHASPDTAASDAAAHRLLEFAERRRVEGYEIVADVLGNELLR